MKLEHAVIVKSTIDGQTSEEYESFAAANKFMEDISTQSELKENYRDHEQWYIETEDFTGYELRYEEYEK